MPAKYFHKWGKIVIIFIYYSGHWKPTFLPSLSCNHSGVVGSIKKTIRLFTGPKYSGEYLHKLVKDKLGDTKLHQTLTNVVIPTFDIKRLHPTVFSSYEVVVLSNVKFVLSFSGSSYNSNVLLARMLAVRCMSNLGCMLGGHLHWQCSCTNLLSCSLFRSQRW